MKQLEFTVKLTFSGDIGDDVIDLIEQYIHENK